MSEFNFEDKTKNPKNNNDFVLFLKVALCVGVFCAFYAACNRTFSAIKEQNQKIKDGKQQEKNIVDTVQARNYLYNTHQIVIFQDTAKTK